MKNNKYDDYEKVSNHSMSEVGSSINPVLKDRTEDTNKGEYGCKYALYEYVKGQSRFSSLILYAYLFWWFIVMFTFGIPNIDSSAWISACVLASFVSLALNAAAFHPPLLGPNGYLRHYWKLLKFWLIPFCVSSISVACNASPNDCKYLFPTDPILLATHVAVMIGIIVIGAFVHYYLLPKVYDAVYDNTSRNEDFSQVEKAESDDVIDSGTINSVCSLSTACDKKSSDASNINVYGSTITQIK